MRRSKNETNFRVCLFKKIHENRSISGTIYTPPASFIIYISKGMLSSLMDGAKVLNTIAQQRMRTNIPNLQIHTIVMLPSNLASILHIKIL